MAETLNTYQPQPAESQAHVNEMVKKADNLSNTETQEGRPDWLPEKFNSAEDMAKAYSQLENKMANPDDGQAGEAPEELSEARDAVEGLGLNFDDMTTEFSEQGGLTEDTYQKLADAGIPSNVVDAFIDGQMAVANNVRNDAFGLVGGEENYTGMVEWAAQNLSEQAVGAYNNAIDGSDPNAAKLAIQGLHTQYRMETGTEPSLISGQAASTSSGAFNSVAELTAAMGDPRYGRDPAYRQTVQDRLARSSVF